VSQGRSTHTHMHNAGIARWVQEKDVSEARLGNKQNQQTNKNTHCHTHTRPEHLDRPARTCVAALLLVASTTLPSALPPIVRVAAPFRCAPRSLVGGTHRCVSSAPTPPDDPLLSMPVVCATAPRHQQPTLQQDVTPQAGKCSATAMTCVYSHASSQLPPPRHSTHARTHADTHRHTQAHTSKHTPSAHRNLSLHLPFRLLLLAHSCQRLLLLGKLPQRLLLLLFFLLLHGFVDMLSVPIALAFLLGPLLCLLFPFPLPL